MVTYNQNGTSRGVAALTFTKRDTAAKAAKELNGLLVDGRPMKVGNGLETPRRYNDLTDFFRLKSLSTRPMHPRPLPLNH